MPLFTHKQKYTLASVVLGVSFILAIVAMNVQWSQFKQTDGVQRIFLRRSERCLTNVDCVEVCHTCQCGSAVSGDATLGLLCCAVILAAFSRYSLWSHDKGSDGPWGLLATISMALAFLCALMAPVAWGVGCHANATAINAPSGSASEVVVTFGAGFILSIVVSILLFFVSIYYGRITGVCGGGVNKTEASF